MIQPLLKNQMGLYACIETHCPKINFREQVLFNISPASAGRLNCSKCMNFNGRDGNVIQHLIHSGHAKNYIG